MKLRKQLEVSERYAKEFEEALEKEESVYALERLAQLLIQSLLDLGAMVSHCLGKRPNTYRGLAKLLAEKAGLRDEEGSFLEYLVSCRKLFVYSYAKPSIKEERRVFKRVSEGIFPLLRSLREGLKALLKEEVSEWSVKKYSEVLDVEECFRLVEKELTY